MIQAMFGGDWLALLLAVFVIGWILFSVVCGAAILFEPWLSRLIHAFMVVLHDTKVELGSDGQRPLRWMALFRMRSKISKGMTDSALRKAQALTEGSEIGSFESDAIGEALGAWIGWEFGRLHETESRKRMVDEVAALVRRIRNLE